MTKQVLVVDDEQAMCDMLATSLGRRGFDVQTTTSPAVALERVVREDCGVVVTDLQMPGVDGIELCTRIVANRPDLPVIVLTSFGSFEMAVVAIRAGAYDFLTKPVDMDTVVLALDRALKHRELREEVRQLRIAVRETQHLGEILGASPVRKIVFDLVGRVVEAGPSVLMPLEEVEHRHILRVLEASSGNKASAARILGLDRKTLYRKLERWGASDPAEPGAG